MKKTILVIAVCSFIIKSLFLTGCSSSAQKADKAEQNVIKTNNDLDNANKAYITDIENYRKETAKKIATNNQSITEFKARVNHDKKFARADYNKKIADLEQKNHDMKKRMDDYKANGKENWETFKRELNHDMDELGKSFKDFTVKNEK